MSVVPASWTDDWEGVGRAGAAAKFAELSSENQCTPLLYELFRAVLQGSLKSEHLIELLTEMDASVKVPDFGSVRHDTFSLYDACPAALGALGAGDDHFRDDKGGVVVVVV
jgi:hypothetical protein